MLELYIGNTKYLVPNCAKIPKRIKKNTVLEFRGYYIAYDGRELQITFRSNSHIKTIVHGNVYPNKIVEFKCIVTPKSDIDYIEYKFIPGTLTINKGYMSIHDIKVDKEIITTLNIANRDKYVRQTYVIYNPNKVVKVYYKDKEKIVKVVETTIVVEPKGE